MTNIKDLVETHIGEIFYTVQKENEIRDGDIGFDRTFKLDEIRDQLLGLIEDYLKEATIRDDEIVGFVFKHGDKDYEYWETDAISKEDQQKILEILNKYNGTGWSVRNVYEEIMNLS